MKVRVGNVRYDGKEEPICVILTAQDRLMIQAMPPDYTKFAAGPDTMGQENLEKWLVTDVEELETGLDLFERMQQQIEGVLWYLDSESKVVFDIKECMEVFKAKLFPHIDDYKG